MKSRVRPEMLQTFWVASAALPLVTLTLLRQASLRALGHPVVAASQKGRVRVLQNHER